MTAAGTSARFYTAAEQARLVAEDMDGEPLDIPSQGIAPTGGDSPEDAFDAMLDSVSRLDLTGIVAALNPNEFAALQRYAPLFIAEGQAEIDAAGVTMRLDEAEYDTSVDGDTATIAVTYLAGEITAEGESATFRLEDGCLIAEVPGEGPFNSCDIVDENRHRRDVTGDPGRGRAVQRPARGLRQPRCRS